MCRAEESARAASLYEAVKTYVGDGQNRNNSQNAPAGQTGQSENKLQESFSLSDHNMRESVSPGEQRLRETNDNTEDENIDNGNISTDRSETASGRDEVNI